MEIIETIFTICFAIAAGVAGLWLRSWAYEKRVEELYGYKPRKKKRY